MRGKRPEVVSAAVRSALRETVFRFELVMRINVTVHDLLDHEVLLEALFAAHLALLLHDERKERLTDESHLHRLAQCRDLTALRVTELLATQRGDIESRGSLPRRTRRSLPGGCRRIRRTRSGAVRGSRKWPRTAPNSMASSQQNRTIPTGSK
jgi:hypothetical protein